MNLQKIKAHLVAEAKTQGFYGQFLEKIDSADQWDDLDALCAIYGITDTDDLDEFLQVNDYFRNRRLTDLQETATRYEWRVNGDSFSRYCKPFRKVSKRIYWYFLEILPPIYKRNGFMVSEPYSYDEEAQQNTYSAFVCLNGDYYWLGDIAPKNYEVAISKLLSEV